MDACLYEELYNDRVSPDVRLLVISGPLGFYLRTDKAEDLAARRVVKRIVKHVELVPTHAQHLGLQHRVVPSVGLRVEGLGPS